MRCPTILVARVVTTLPQVGAGAKGGVPVPMSRFAGMPV